MRKKCLFFLPLLLVLLTGCEKKCPDGFTMDGNKCIREIERFEAEAVYDCEEDTILEGINCVRNIFVEPSEGTGCEDGLTLENGYCVGTLKESPVDAYKCNSGEELKGNKCIKSTVDNAALTKTGKCQTGYTYEDGACWSGQKMPMGCDWEHGDYNGCFCAGGDKYKDGWCYEKKTAEYDYKCANGTVLKNNKCYQQTESNATSYKKCNSGYTLNGNECTKAVKEKAGKVLNCEDGYTLEGNQCKKVETTPARVTYSCSNGYEVIDKYCVKREVKEVE